LQGATDSLHIIKSKQNKTVFLINFEVIVNRYAAQDLAASRSAASRPARPLPRKTRMLAGARASSLPCSWSQGRQGSAHTGFSLARKQGECEIDFIRYYCMRRSACVTLLSTVNISRPNPIFHAAEKPGTLLFAIMYHGAFTKFAELQEKEKLLQAQKEAEQAQKEAERAQKEAEKAQKLADIAVVGPIAVITCLSRIRAPPKRCLTSLGPLKFGLWTQMRLGSEPRILTAPSSCCRTCATK